MQAPNDLGNTKVLSIDYRRDWSNRTVSRLKKTVSRKWLTYYRWGVPVEKDWFSEMKTPNV